ncbi:MAG: sulfurtransferase [Rhizobiales bacterium]|nr:sulfurtransferase [Hyphomicrobiales bacterium]
MSQTLKPIDAAAAARLRDKGALMVDVREPGEYGRSHIPQSQNMPLSRFEEIALPAGPKQPVVFYCASGNRTTVARARLAAKAGALDSYVLEGGISAWGRAGLPLESGRGEGEGRAPGRGLLARWFGL